ncbi:hypothetical protein AAFF_G00142410 [Aldrovandia affinis]|uniref:CBM21 domain-containing protein n=1 Tax=Aldrovandia affinis TaxID=143900 RepID=A0AAD7WXL6_9TELE|nr:hypothetical protein AAFF_G00142410 [Aldrovandia affinis]
MSLNDSKFLTIPSEEALFTTVKKPRSAEKTCNSPADDDDDEETEQNYRLVPRSSPVPRRRGLSVFDETAEYMKIRLAMPSRRVSFVDSHGGDLVEVKEFVAFDSDEEEDPRWEEEQARYRPVRREPIYQLRPDFHALAKADLVLALQTNKVEVESVSSVEDEPLAFTGLIRVMNICFNKHVYVRFTMDSWGTYFDYPADYVQGSNDVETDLYSFKLTFAPPYITHGSRIEFVLRYETPEGDYWANNAGRNYAMVLNLSYKDEGARGNGVDDRKLKSILKPTRYRMEDDYEQTLAVDNGEEESSSIEAEMVVPKPCPMLPQIIQPEIDIELIEASAVI